MSNNDLDRRFRTRPGAPWQGWGVWPGQPIPNPSQVIYVVGCRVGQKVRVFGCDPVYCAQAKPDRLQLYGYEWAMEYVEKTGGPDAWRFRAEVQWRRILNAQKAAERLEEVEQYV